MRSDIQDKCILNLCLGARKPYTQSHKNYKYKFSFEELKSYLKTVKNGYFIYYYFQNSSSLLEREDCKRYFIENHKFKEVLEYFDELENYNKASGEGDFIVRFDSALKRRNSIGS